MTILLTEDGEFAVNASGGLWLSAGEAERATGWTLKPEGMCKGEICVPLGPEAMGRERIDVEALWHQLDAPIIHDDAREVWALGTAADARNAVLEGLNAPDFTLRDLNGSPHRLSDLRGKKVFLATWASW
jgi:hypothetical protein